jgi:hypothetical protein
MSEVGSYNSITVMLFEDANPIYAAYKNVNIPSAAKYSFRNDEMKPGIVLYHGDCTHIRLDNIASNSGLSFVDTYLFIFFIFIFLK